MILEDALEGCHCLFIFSDLLVNQCEPEHHLTSAAEIRRDREQVLENLAFHNRRGGMSCSTKGNSKAVGTSSASELEPLFSYKIPTPYHSPGSLQALLECSARW